MQLITCALLATCLATLMIASAPGVSAVPFWWGARRTAPSDGEAPLQTNKRFWGAFLIGAAAVKILGKRDQPMTADEPLTNEETPVEDDDNPNPVPVVIGAGIVILDKQAVGDDESFESGAQPTLLLLNEASEDELIKDRAVKNSICIGEACTFWPDELTIVTNQEVKVSQVELGDGQVGVVSESKRRAVDEETVEKRTWKCGVCIGPKCKGLWSCSGCVGSNCGK